MAHTVGACLPQLKRLKPKEIFFKDAAGIGRMYRYLWHGWSDHSRQQNTWVRGWNTASRSTFKTELVKPFKVLESSKSSGKKGEG